MLQLLGQDPERQRRTNECREKIRVLKDAIQKKVATYNLEVLKQVMCCICVHIRSIVHAR